MMEIKRCMVKSQYIEEITALLQQCNRESVHIYILCLLQKLLDKEETA